MNGRVDPTDRLEIVDLLHRLALAADDAPDDQLDVRYRANLTDDASWEMVTATHIDRREGVDAVMEGVLERRSTGRNGPGTGVRHHITTVVIEPTSAEHWTVVSYFLVTDPAGRVRSSGRYTDHVTRIDGRCRLVRRRVEPAAPQPNADTVVDAAGTSPPDNRKEPST